MLSNVAAFAMTGRWHASLLIALFSLGAFILPPLFFIAGGILVVATLSKGPKEGTIVLLGAAVVTALFMQLLIKSVYPAGLLVISWLPLLFISLILGYTRSLSTALLSSTGLGLLFLVVIYSVVDDPAQWWQVIVEARFEKSSEQAINWSLSPAETKVLIASVSEMMTGVLAAVISLIVMTTLLIGRAWQAKLYNKGGFSTEFYKLSLGKPAALAMTMVAVIVVLPLEVDWSLIQACMPVLMIVFVLQGIAVVHAIVYQQQQQTFWLVAMYTLLVITMPYMLVLLAMIGVLEQWFNFRKHSLTNDTSEF